MRRYRGIGCALPGALLGFMLLASLGGCGAIGTIHQADAFGAAKTYAVVTVMASEKTGCSDAGGSVCNGGLFGLIRTVADSNAFSEDSTATLESTYTGALQGLRSSANLRIVPDVRATRAYRETPADEQPTGPLRPRQNLAKGYKYFSNEKLGKLARDLKVDGVITVMFSYTAVRSGVPVAGFGGGHMAKTFVIVNAVDKDGKTVWADMANALSDDSAGTASGTVNFPKLRPLFGEASTKAVKELMDNFNQKTRKM